MKSRNRNLARLRKEHQCSVWHTEVELFPNTDDGRPVITIVEELCPHQLDTQETGGMAASETEDEDR